MRVLQENPQVALTIDTTEIRIRVLLIRGVAAVEIVDGAPPEYAETARRYYGEEQGAAWVEQVVSLCPRMARVTITPTWAGILDFSPGDEARLPSAVARAIERAKASAG